MDKDDLLKLDNQLCFALYSCSKEVTSLYKPYLDKLGITYTQYITLLALWEEDNLTVKSIGSKLYLDSGTLTPLLKRLEASGLIKRTRDKKDERTVIISLTEAGKALKEQAYEIPQKISCNTRVSPEELIKLRNSLKNLLSDIIDN